jgi:hypothetical protein
LHALLEARGIDPEDLINDYTALRKARRKTRSETSLAKVQSEVFNTRPSPPDAHSAASFPEYSPVAPG